MDINTIVGLLSLAAGLAIFVSISTSRRISRATVLKIRYKAIRRLEIFGLEIDPWIYNLTQDGLANFVRIMNAHKRDFIAIKWLFDGDSAVAEWANGLRDAATCINDLHVVMWQSWNIDQDGIRNAEANPKWKAVCDKLEKAESKFRDRDDSLFSKYMKVGK